MTSWPKTEAKQHCAKKKQNTIFFAAAAANWTWCDEVISSIGAMNERLTNDYMFHLMQIDLMICNY